MDQKISTADFLRMYPSFRRTSEQQMQFSGSIKLDNKFYRLNLTIPHFPLLKKAHCCIFMGLNVFSPKNNDIDENWNIFDFMNNFPSLVEKQKCSANESENLENRGLKLKQLFQNLIEAKKNNKCEIFTNKSYTFIKFRNFAEYPKHFLDIDVSNLSNIKVSNHSLIDSKSMELFREVESLDGALKEFHKLLEEFSDFYTNLNTIDELCTVVDPDPVTTKHDWRIIKLSEKVLVRIVVNPYMSSSVTVKLIGPTYEVEKFRSVYDKRIQKWDADMDVHANLLRIFGIPFFPMPNNSSEEECEKYCNICYTYRLHNKVPIVSCDNPRCDLIFHVVCIREWFHYHGKTAFSVTLGSCPSCKEKLSASLVDLLEI